MQRCDAGEAQERAADHHSAGSAGPCAAAGCNIGMRSIALYQSIILAVRHIVAMPTTLTASCIAIAESYSTRIKCPSADKRMLRQKISNDFWQHNTRGRAALPPRVRAVRRTLVQT